MALDKQDLKEIKKIVDSSIDKSEARMSDKIELAIDKSEMKLSDKMEFMIGKSEQRLEAKIGARIKESEKRINAHINKEIFDLAETNREFITKIDNHEERIVRLETKVGIKVT